MSYPHENTNAWSPAVGYSPVASPSSPGENLRPTTSYGTPASPPRRKPYVGPAYFDTPSTIATEWASPDPNSRLLGNEPSSPPPTFSKGSESTEDKPAAKSNEPKSHEPLDTADLKKRNTVNFVPAPGLFSAWGFEILSVTFALACVVAIIVILSQIDGKPLSSWPIQAVSPNAIISAVSTAAKASMILPVAESISQLKWLYLARQTLSLRHLQAFDDASRGPWGALLFFFRSKSFWRWATFVPFIGCIVTIAAIATDPFTQQVLSYQESSTLVVGAHSVAKRSQDYDWGGKGLNGVGSVLSKTRDGLLEAASVSGLYDLVAAPPLTCPGSNCTYPDFMSLGIASSCRDVTADTKQSCKRFKTSIPNQICNYTLPSGYELGSYAGSDAHNGFYHTLVNTTTDNLIYDDTGVPDLVGVGIVRFGDKDVEGNFEVSTQWQSTLSAWECRFGIVAHTYRGWRSLNGTVHPGAIEVSALNRTGMGPVIPFDVLGKDNQTVQINYYDMQNMASMLSNIYSPASAPSAYSSALFNSPDLAATAANIARGMSYRMLAGPNSTEVHGDVFAVQTYMQVHWRWLALMMTLVAITVVFFVVVVVQTRTQGQRAWKSSLVPILYGGHEVLMAGGEYQNEEKNKRQSVKVTDRGGGVWEVPAEYNLGRTQSIVSQLR